MASIRSRSGKWQARIKRGEILVEKSFLNKRDAERWARLTEAEIERGEYTVTVIDNSPTTPPQTLNDVLQRYLDEVAPQHRSNTTRFNIGILKATLGQTELAKLNAQAVAQWRDERLKTVKPPTVARGLNTLSAVLNHARKEWCIQIANPIPDIKRPALGQARTRRLIGNEDERLFHELGGNYGPVAQFALATAMRRGEVLALRTH